MSSLAWIDFDEAERQRAQRIMDMFNERDTRDELGLGSVRDSLSDHLFPGTSTIQTRLRYMLFVPWIFRMVAAGQGSPDHLMAQARAMEIRLANSLKAGGETHGIIGRDAGARLQRLPSSVYWAGLGAWGIRSFAGSIVSYFATLPSMMRRRQRLAGEEDHAIAASRALDLWCPALPDPPKGLLDDVTFRLTSDEAEFIIDRLVNRQPHSLLTLLAADRIDADCEFIWEHPSLAEFPVEMRRLINHCEMFSRIMYGASLLYNMQLSELRGRDDWVAKYQSRLDEWCATLDLHLIGAWSLEDFWMVAAHPSHNIRPATKRFVNQWLDIVTDSGSTTPSSQRARELVQNRERRLKSSLSRFTNRAVRDRWTGSSGADRLSFRWGQAKQHLRDLAHAE